MTKFATNSNRIHLPIPGDLVVYHKLCGIICALCSLSWSRLSWARVVQHNVRSLLVVCKVIGRRKERHFLVWLTSHNMASSKIHIQLVIYVYTNYVFIFMQWTIGKYSGQQREKSAAALSWRFSTFIFIVLRDKWRVVIENVVVVRCTRETLYSITTDHQDQRRHLDSGGGRWSVAEALLG